MTIHASPLKVEVNETSSLEINHDDDDGDLWGFAAEGVHTLETDQDSIKLDPYSTKIINNILFKSSYFPRMLLGFGLKKTISPPIPNKGLTFGLGYDPSDQELKEHLAFLKSNKILARKGVIPLLPSFKRTLNGQFIREGENHPFYRFPEPLVRGGIQMPGFEIFHDCHFLDCAPITVSAKHSTPECYDRQAFDLLFRTGKEPNPYFCCNHSKQLARQQLRPFSLDYPDCRHYYQAWLEEDFQMDQ